MPCDILILHDSPFIKKTIQQIMLAEFNEVRGEMSDSLEDCRQKLDHRLYHMILCPQKAADWTVVDLRELLEKSRLNKKTPIVVLTPTAELLHQAVLASQGFDYTLSISDFSKELSNIVNLLYKPREFRASPRYFIPQAIVTLHCEDGDEPADIINISRHGIYCEMFFTEKPQNLLAPCSISIQFSEGYNSCKISSTGANLLRLQVGIWNPDHSPQYLTGVWKFTEISEADQAVLDTVLEKAAKDMAELEILLKQERDFTFTSA